MRYLMGFCVVFWLATGCAQAAPQCPPPPPDAVYQQCQWEWIRVYERANVIYWGRMTAVTEPKPTPGCWIERPLQHFGRSAIVSFIGCALMARNLDENRLLTAMYRGQDKWSLPMYLQTVSLPLVIGGTR